MTILTIRTDRPEAELGLYNDHRQAQYITWLAHRELSTTLHQKIRTLLSDHEMTLADVGGIVCYKGPGSFTGLRIGLAVANSLAYSLSIPIVARNSEEWQAEGVDALLKGENDKVGVPEYGGSINVSTPRK